MNAARLLPLLEACWQALCHSQPALVERQRAKVAAETPSYTGHGPAGGLQQHSVDDDYYPWTVIGQGDLNPPLYRAFHCFNGRKGTLRTSCRQAHEDARGFARADRLARAVQQGTVHSFNELTTRAQ